MSETYRVTFVCSGNICRSPMGEIILRSMLADTDLANRVEVNSRGTGGWHEGDGADPRTLTALTGGGYDGSSHVAHELSDDDLQRADLVLVADTGHLRSVRRMAQAADAQPRIQLMREFDPDAVVAGTLEVDDPYYGDAAGFERCRDEVEAACRGVADFLRTALGRGRRGDD